jgi:hypothetical protein
MAAMTSGANQELTVCKKAAQGNNKPRNQLVQFTAFLLHQALHQVQKKLFFLLATVAVIPNNLYFCRISTLVSWCHAILCISPLSPSLVADL